MKTIVCYGDSNTYGYDPHSGLRYPEGVRWTSRLRSYLGKDFSLIEEGCNGRTALCIDPEEPWKYGLPYLKPCLNSHKPVDILLLMLGTNDLKKSFGVAAEAIAGGMSNLIRTARDFAREKQGQIISLVLVAPPALGAGIESSPFADEFDESCVRESEVLRDAYSRLAMEESCLFFDAGQFVSVSEEDSLHLDASAHRKLAENLFAFLRTKGLI